MKAKQIQFALRFLVSVGLITFLLVKAINWGEMQETFQRVNLYYLILAVLLSFIMIIVSTWKWKVLLSAQGIELPLNKLFLFYMVGYFFTNFLPSNIGGDVVRGYEVSRRTNRYAEVFSSIFMERFTGLAVLIAMMVAAPLISPYILKNRYLMMVIGLFFTGFVFFVSLLFSQRALKKVKRKIRFKGSERIKKKLSNLYKAIYSFRGKREILFKVMLISIIFYLLTIVNILFAALVFDIPISIRGILTMTPIVMVISMLPVSVSGVGLSEGAYVYCFSLIGISPSEAFSIALLMRARLIFVGLIGGVIFAFLREGMPPKGIERNLRAEGVLADG